MERKVISGNDAAALAVKLSRVQVVSAYPITPATSIGEKIAEMWAQGEFPGEYVGVESEYSSISYIVGAAHIGARTFTATSCQGLAYMHEQLHWASGARLPIVLVNVNRNMAAPWNVEPDQLDSLSQRDTGWIQLYCGDAQEIMDTVILAFRLVQEVRLPCMVIYDGFVLSHTYEVVEIPTQEQVDAFLPPPRAAWHIDPSKPETFLGITDSKFMARSFQARHLSMLRVAETVKELELEFKRIFGRDFSVIETVGLEDAETVIVTAGALGQTVKSALAHLKGEDSSIGLLRIKLFRPFPRDEVLSLVEKSNVRNIIVIDRNLSAGTGGIFAQELRAVLQTSPHHRKVWELNLAGGIDLMPDMLAKAIDLTNDGTQAREEIIWGLDLSC